MGGLSDGSPIILRAAISLRLHLKASADGNPKRRGNHHLYHRQARPCHVPRAVVVVESMAAITIVDLLMTGMSSTMENLLKNLSKIIPDPGTQLLLRPDFNFFPKIS